MLHLEEKVTEQTRQYKKTNAELLLEIESRKELQEKLEQALGKVKQLSGFLPICSSCKKIRDDQGYWNQVEQFIQEHSEAEFSHGLCPECAQKIYPDLFDKDTEE
jgi:lysyl-tRNA synthetase class I